MRKREAKALAYYVAAMWVDAMVLTSDDDQLDPFGRGVDFSEEERQKINRALLEVRDSLEERHWKMVEREPLPTEWYPPSAAEQPLPDGEGHVG